MGNRQQQTEVVVKEDVVKEEKMNEKQPLKLRTPKNLRSTFLDPREDTGDDAENLVNLQGAAPEPLSAVMVRTPALEEKVEEVWQGQAK